MFMYPVAARIGLASLLAWLSITWSASASPLTSNLTTHLPIFPSSTTTLCTETITITDTSQAETTTVTQTNTVIVIPYVTPYPNGTNITNFVTIGHTKALSVARNFCHLDNSCTTSVVRLQQLSDGCAETITTTDTELITETYLFDVTWTKPVSFMPTVTVEPSSQPENQPTAQPGASPDQRSTPIETSPDSPPSTLGNPAGVPTGTSSVLALPAETQSDTLGNSVGAPTSFEPLGTDSKVIFSPPIATTQPAALPTGFSILPSGLGLLLPNGETLKPGASTVVNGATISLSPSATEVVIGSTTVPLAAQGTDLVVLPDGETLVPGVLTTINGFAISLAPSLTAVVIDGSTISLSPSATEVVIGSTTVPLAAQGTDLVVLPDGETLVPGVLTTINGFAISLAPSLTAVVIDGSTMALTTIASSEIDDAIWNSLGGTPSTSALAQFTGAANDRKASEKWEGWAVYVVAVIHMAL